MQPAIALMKSQEAIIAILLNHDGLFYNDLLMAAMKATGHSSNTIAKAAKALKEEGAVRATRVRYQVRYSLTERAVHRKREQEDCLPVRRQVISAVEAPRVRGARLSPFEWIVATLMEVA